jgi:hypothetical protein
LLERKEKKNMKKRIITNVLAVSVVAAMAMSVAACGNQTEETAAETEETTVETSVEETVAETTVAETVAETEAAEASESEIEYSIDENILGTWNLEDNGIVSVYTFNDDNTGVVEYSGEGFEEPTAIDCTYSADGETIVIYVDGMESDRALYVVDGDTLTIGEGEEAIVLAR